MRSLANLHIERSVILASRAFCALRVTVNLHQLYKAPLIVIGPVLCRMAHLDGSLHIDLIRSERIKRVVSVTASRGGPCILRSRSIRAPHDPGKETCETESDGGHTAAYDTNLTLDYRPETGFQVVPRHVDSVGEVDERAEAKY